MFAFLYDTNNKIIIQFRFIELNHVKFKKMKERKRNSSIGESKKNLYSN